MIILPDIHGRKFWKEVVDHKQKDEKVVFLGDYLEPYTDLEGITHEMAYENFLEILEYKKANSDDCILLLGNHDYACIDKCMISCRHDYKNAERNTKTFFDNMNLFKLAYSVDIEGITYLMTHAGVHKEWIEDLPDEFWDKDKSIVDNLNGWLTLTGDEKYKMMTNCLSIYSYYRGYSPYNYGSCVWADVREWNTKEPEFENMYQVFGHTQLKEGFAIITDWWADLDCHCGFLLNEYENNKYGDPKARLIKI